MQGRMISTLLLALLVAACDEVPQPGPPEQSDPEPLGTEFRPTDTGRIVGQVTWEGTVPTVAPYWAPEPGGTPGSPMHWRNWPNPNAPRIAGPDQGVGNAVVFLRVVDLRRSRPWDLPDVRVEMKDFQATVRQGKVVSPHGFVRCGTRVTMVLADPSFQVLHADGAAFFSLTFVEPDLPRVRRLERVGVVELSSMAGCYWLRNYLFVCEHPYFARTDAQGHFVLEQVPSGTYELVCWHPDWRESGRDRDPETGLVSRLRFAPPREVIRKVTVQRGAEAEVRFTLTEEPPPTGESP